MTIDFVAEMARLAAEEAGCEPGAIAGCVAAPRDKARYTFAFPSFQLARQLGEAPPALAARLAQAIARSPLFEACDAQGPFVNARVEPAAFATAVLDRVAAEGERYGGSEEGAGRAVVIDYSSPNIAKRFHIGHLRSTVIGQAIYRLHAALGYRPVGVNHLGDWGTQFGHLLSAWSRWGDEARLEEDPIGFLQELYVRHNKAAKEDESYSEAARTWFKRLEDGDEAARTLWKRFLELSLKDFDRVYKLLGVTFDEFKGESFYVDQTDDAIRRCEEKGISEVSDGALIISFQNQGVKGIKQPLLLKRSDGATLYATRDVAAGIYRFETYDPARIIYVIGQEQKLAMRQLFCALGLLGYDASRCKHVWFGRVLGMSSRAGTAVLLDDVLGHAMDLARKIVLEKNPEILGDELEHVVRAVGVGACVFADLKNGLKKDFRFDWDRIVQFKGETGPYLQYTHARLSSILRKLAEEGAALEGTVDGMDLADVESQGVLQTIYAYPARLKRAADTLEPAVLAQHLLDVAQAFNLFYKHRSVKHAGEEGLLRARARLVTATRQVIANGLRILGVVPLDRM